MYPVHWLRNVTDVSLSEEQRHVYESQRTFIMVAKRGL